MSNQENKDHNSGFFAGFILGVATALLLNTKKGKKILKILIDQGIDRIGNWEEVVKDIIEEKEEDDLDEDLMKGDDFVKSSTDVKKITHTSEQNEDYKISEDFKSALDSSNNNPVVKVKTVTRRFFRGIKRKPKA